MLRHTLIVALVIGGFLSFIAAFDSGHLPFATRTLLMVGIAWTASLMGAAAFAVVERSAWVRGAWWRVGLAGAALMFAPMGLVVWCGVRLAAPPQGDPPVTAIPGFIGVSFVTSLFFCMVVAWFQSRAAHGPQAGTPAPPKFLERLPLKLRGAEVWAVEAEDHYLRLHTSKGQDLILMRLADAVAELEGIEGLQVHRSWWVARDAIVDARRGDGRATLTLKDGVQVPVSRTYAGELRARGWI
ncbi:LytTR family DNA-binding domain-containing protein [Phenylobacterium sp.]|uniref:LytTR family DNA-binding domain-containing protein n=1 Tax=Phenylobacterium sp. TaxID=1871053 RepID=UPI002810E6CC|nr:LytTR family DNA-binding domain-containing protein [Phenylobacterium sp.]